MQKVIQYLRSPLALPLGFIALVVVYYWGIYDFTAVVEHRRSELVWWMVDSWNERNDLLHGFAVPVLFAIFCYRAVKPMRAEASSSGLFGVALVILGLLLFLAAARTIQPRLALIGLPFIISGAGIYVGGWKAGRHLLFPAFFWYFAMPVPGLNQMTNVLQVMVTKACYLVGDGLGMGLVYSGNNITSATDKWQFNIAEGCSGIRSLMALLMIASVFAYYSQKELWKKAVVFLSAFPLALFGNFLRVFTILVLAEMGFEDFAANAYHDFAGLLFFFPAALIGLFVLDRLINPSRFKRKLKITQKG